MGNLSHMIAEPRRDCLVYQLSLGTRLAAVTLQKKRLTVVEHNRTRNNLWHTTFQGHCELKKPY